MSAQADSTLLERDAAQVALQQTIRLVRCFYDDLVLCSSWNIHFGPYFFKNLIDKNTDAPVRWDIDNPFMNRMTIELSDHFDRNPHGVVPSLSAFPVST
jgi:hypothetical protein